MALDWIEMLPDPKRFKLGFIIGLLATALLQSACGSVPETQRTDRRDPYEGSNRRAFALNMGLDTHDYGLLDEPMVENMVFTVEPGIYIPEENLGIRLEDDVVIKNSGTPINLMKSIPIEIEEIEEIMNS